MKHQKRKRNTAFISQKKNSENFSVFSAEAKLEWLEEANKFINEFLPSEKRKRWDEFIRRQ